MRYDFAILADLMRLPEHAAAAKLNLSGSTMVEYRERGVTEQVAERLAVRAGFHPFAVWPELTDVRCRSVEQVCEGCEVRFVAARPQAHQRFCTEKCRRNQPHYRKSANASSVRYRRGKGAESNRARRRAYYAENAEYEKARERASYWARKAS